jgi:L-ascorbate metabolism protein UlaG (beta-lactamase superfamily)
MVSSVKTITFALVMAVSFAGHVAADCPVGDLNWDCKVNGTDLQVLTSRWLDPNCLSPGCEADTDGIAGVNMSDFGLLAESWLEDHGPIVHIKWLGHASFKIWDANTIIYLDPRKLGESAKDATLVLVSHTHSDHYSPTDITKIWGPQTKLIAPADVIAKEPQERKDRAILLLPGQTIQAGGVRITGVAAYNITKPNHPKANNWLGFIIEIGSMRVYDAGDTDLTDEMKALQNIDVAILPVGGTYTMNADEAAQATTYIQPRLAIPDHWGDIVGTRADAERFASLAQCDVKIMDVGETISSAGWLKDFALIEHWKLDETEGNIAHDFASGNNGTLYGSPTWQPVGGKVDGALEFDGVDDYVSTPFILNPSAGAFSAFFWAKGGAPGQVLIYQQNGLMWLGSDSSYGKLMTTLKDANPFRSALVSDFVITDGEWHQVGVVWDGTKRRLYADKEEIAKDSSNLGQLLFSDGGLYIGAGPSLVATYFWCGLIDDVRIYDRAVTP